MDEFLFPFVIGSVVDRNGHSGADRAVCDKPRALQWVHVFKLGSLHSVPAVFFLSGVVPPLTADLAAAAREVPGLGCKGVTLRSIRSEICLTGFRHADAHVFGAFNFAYSLSSAGGFS
jgi:hypothetical protein